MKRMQAKNAASEQGQIAPGLSPSEYARQHGITIDWVYRLIRIGRLPHVRIFGRLFIVGGSVEE